MTAPLVRTDEVAAAPSTLSGSEKAGPGHGLGGADDTAVIVRQAWRRWRVPLALIGVIVLGGISIGAISRLLPPPRSN
ncbi:MAG: hypothetical protein ACTHJW_01730, partial [Streptosporangiaceae bacterium]